MELFCDHLSQPNPTARGVMIFLHGFLASSSNLKSFAKRFSRDGYDIYIPDLRNHGQSPHSREMSYEIMAQDIHRLIDQKNLDRVILCGHSMGGKVGMSLIHSHPQQIEKLIVLDISPDYREIGDLRHIVATLAGLDLNRYANREEVRDHLLNKLSPPILVDFLLKNLVSQPQLEWQCHLDLFSESIDFLSREIILSPPVESPTLFVGGENSDYISEANHPLIHRSFQKVEIAMIEDAGHWLHYEKPDILYRCLSQFLNSSW